MVRKKKSKADTLITTEKKFAHTNFDGKPLNYKKNSKFARTQDLKPIETCNYALMIWKRKSFLKCSTHSYLLRLVVLRCCCNVRFYP